MRVTDTGQPSVELKGIAEKSSKGLVLGVDLVLELSFLVFDGETKVHGTENLRFIDRST